MPTRRGTRDRRTLQHGLGGSHSKWLGRIPNGGCGTGGSGGAWGRGLLLRGPPGSGSRRGRSRRGSGCGFRRRSGGCGWCRRGGGGGWGRGGGAYLGREEVGYGVDCSQGGSLCAGEVG